MKWLLITTLGKNVGDEFARIGVQNLIREVDPQATFDLVCKESPAIHQPRPFDRAVLCGMPLFWSIYSNECQEIDWWKPIIRGWVSANKRNFAVIGAGHVFVNEIFNFKRYCEAIGEVIERAHVVTVREPIIDHPKIIESVCPAYFATTPEETGGYKLCNLMPEGGHHFCLRTQDEEIKYWKHILPELSQMFRNADFCFVAHDKTEHDLALKLGWHESGILTSDTPEGYLEIYRRAGMYFGNRLHGAVVSASVGARTWAVAADSRIHMLDCVGADACYPRKVEVERVAAWIEREYPVPGSSLRWKRTRLKKILTDFASSP